MTQTVLLGDVVRINPTTTLKKGTTSKFVSMDKLDPFKRKISSHEEREYKGGSKFMNRDTLLARITPCLENGKTAFVDVLEDDEVGAGSTEFIVLRAVENITDPDYIYYLSISPDFRSFAIQAMIGTSGRQRVQNDVLSRYKFELPDIETQQKIGEQLRTLDEKIELNRRMNETLEQMGQALFRHYFIDNPKADKWKVGKFSDVTDVLTGKGSTKSQLSESGIVPLYGANGIMGTSEDYLYNEPLVITGRVGTLGMVRAVTGRAWFSDNVLIMKPKISSFGFIYHMAKSFDYISMNRGSSQPLVTQTDLKSRPIKIPDETTLTEFEDNFDALFNQQQANEKQIQTLTTLRDTLLPRLITGKVKI